MEHQRHSRRQQQRSSRRRNNSNKRASASVLVALGIAISRLSGLARETIVSRLLGNSPAADAFAVAMRIPNLLQNLLGEGVLSASFVPVYSELLRESESDKVNLTDGSDLTSGRKKSALYEAKQVAGAVAGLLMTITGVGVLTLITLARPITLVLAPGLNAERFELAVSLTRITAVGVGFAVMSAWCLGVMNSHKRFFLSYVAPMVWNAVQIGALAVAWILALDIADTARALAWGVTIGGAAQMLFQLPLTLHLIRGLKLSWGTGLSRVKEIKRRFFPAVFGRGVVQLTSYLDLILASMLATGAVAALSRSQILYMLPISLFAMSIAASELPEMSRLAQNPDGLITRAQAGTRKVAFWMLLASVIYITVGDMVVNLLFEGGRFSSADTVLVWFIIATYSLGLPATGVSRLLMNTCFALGDTVSPARIAIMRVVTSAAVGTLIMFPLDRVIVSPDGLLNLADALTPAWALTVDEREATDAVRLGAVGLAVGSAAAAWTEVVLLTRLLNRKLGNIGVYASLTALSGATSAAFLFAAVLKLFTATWPTMLSTPLVLGATVFIYAVVAYRNHVQESHMILRPMRKVIWRIIR